MKSLFSIICIFLSLCPAAHAAGVEFLGFSLTGLEMKSIATEVEKAAPGCEAELTLLPPGKYENITSVKYVVLHGEEIFSGAAAGFNELDAARMAVANLRKELAARSGKNCKTYNNYETVCD